MCIFIKAIDEKNISTFTWSTTLFTQWVYPVRRSKHIQFYARFFYRTRQALMNLVKNYSYMRSSWKFSQGFCGIILFSEKGGGGGFFWGNFNHFYLINYFQWRTVIIGMPLLPFNAALKVKIWTSYFRRVFDQPAHA